MARAKSVSYQVRYVGAPYGENESGEIVSTHRTEEAALRARAKLQSNPRYYGSNSTVVRVVDGLIIRPGAEHLATDAGDA
jgi:hypothetical protein